VPRDNQELIAIRLGQSLLAALDRKRATKRQSRSEFIREAIFELVADASLSRDVIYTQDRVGAAKGGRPKKLPKALEKKQRTA
jgi:metal-responsive CopG/Arc/MetJ family transcriptional regulator